VIQERIQQPYKGSQGIEMTSTANQVNGNPPVPQAKAQTPACLKCNGSSRLHCHRKGKPWFRCRSCGYVFHPHVKPLKSTTQLKDELDQLQAQAQHLESQFRAARDAFVIRRRQLGASINKLKSRLRQLDRHRTANTPCCPHCQGPASRVGRTRSGSQRYYCSVCPRYFTQGHTSGNPCCPECAMTMHKNGLARSGAQRYHCPGCRHCFTLSSEQERQNDMRRQAGRLSDLIEEKLPKNLPLEIREELQQELVMAALAGEFELSELDAAVALYRRKVNRESLTGFAYVSLDAVIPQTNGLTYADTLAG
jgi:transposase-like protein